MRFLFVDRILQLIPGKYIQGLKHVTRDDAYLCFDEQGKRCFIPSLMGETLGQLAAWNVMYCNNFTKRPVAGIVSSARLERPAYIGETLLLEAFIDNFDDSAVQYHCVARVGDEEVFTIESALGPMLPMEDFIHPELVRQQFSEINRPGESPSAGKSTSQPVDELATDSLLPTTPMFFDRVLECEPGVQLYAEKCISRAAPYFTDHFPQKPVLPLTVLLECKLNLAREFVSRSRFEKKYRVSGVRRIKMSEFVSPGDVIICHLTIKRHDHERLTLNFRSEVEGRRVCVLDVVMSVVGN